MEEGKFAHSLKSTSEEKLLHQVVLNKRRIALKKVLLKYMGLSLSREQPILHMKDVEYAGLGDELLVVSRALGLEPAEIPLYAEPVAIEVNGIAISLDCEYQFNHFRGLTLQSPVYALPLIHSLSRYKGYCQPDPSHNSGTAGKRSRDRLRLQKNSVPAAGVLKYQALNDFMQDLLPLVHFVPVLRFSVYDQLETPAGSVSMHKLLSGEDPAHFSLLADYISGHLNNLGEIFNLDF